MTVAAWSGARASMREVACALCMPVLSQPPQVSAAVAAAVTGGGVALTLSASLARRGAPLAAAGDGGRLGVGVRGRVLPGLALRAAAGSYCGGWRVAGGCLGS